VPFSQRDLSIFAFLLLTAAVLFQEVERRMCARRPCLMDRREHCEPPAAVRSEPM
jgi:hypothetical protein